MRRSSLRATFPALVVAAAAVPPPAWGQSPSGRADVFVLATLYQRHDSTPAYGHDTLRRLIERIRPDVVVLDVSPRELQERTVHPGKQEYPQVIFPLVEARGYRAYAGEPGEPDFSMIVERLGNAMRAFRAADPDGAAADRAYEEAVFGALAKVWRTPADVNGALTDQLFAARRAYQDRVAGPDVAESWRLWTVHAVGVVRRAQRENPGKRILVLAGVENCAQLRPELGALPELRLVDMEAWLRRHASSTR